MKTELEEFIQNNIEAFNSRTPDASVLQKLQQRMQEADRKKNAKVPVISMRLRWVAAACLILLAGGVSYLALQRTEPAQTALVTPEKTTPQLLQQPSIAAQTTESEPAAKKENIQTEVPAKQTPDIDEEASARKTLLFAALRNNESPSERLAAASKVEQITNTDTDIVDALTNTMNTDANTNVRLAALDALSKFYREPYVKKKLLSSLQKQKDPMVQIALIELLTKMKEVSVLKQLNKMARDENNIQAVKDQAYAGILNLHS